MLQGNGNVPEAHTPGNTFGFTSLMRVCYKCAPPLRHMITLRSTRSDCLHDLDRRPSELPSGRTKTGRQTHSLDLTGRHGTSGNPFLGSHCRLHRKESHPG